MLKNMEEKKIDTIFCNYPIVSYKKKEVIFRADDTPSGVFQIKSGYVRLFSYSSEGEELTLLLLKPRDFYPTRWAFGDLPMKHVLEAFTNVTSYKIPKEEFLKDMQENNELLMQFTKLMVARISSLYDRMNEMAFGTTHTKVLSILTMLSHQFGIKQSYGYEIPISLTHMDIAHLVGLSRESVSIELKNLENQGKIYIKEHKIRFII
jgi:CRP/FNR family transcriptional regulator